MSVIYQKPEINSFGDLAASSYKTTVSIGSISHLEVNVSPRILFILLLINYCTLIVFRLVSEIRRHENSG